MVCFFSLVNLIENIPGVPFLHNEQREVNLVTLSHKGIRSKIVPKTIFIKINCNT